MNDQVPASPTPIELRHLAEGLIENQSTMTLATSKGGEAWAAAVYFVCRGKCFYFFSDPASRHIQEALATGQAASAIHAEASSWKEIRGLQMSGMIESVGSGLDAAGAIRDYMRKFPFVREFFKSGEAFDLAGFSARFRVRLYRFKPTIVYYLDNRIRFGFREPVSL
jgi:uncharacterized protein YhbP (UPF0306 family)